MATTTHDAVRLLDDVQRLAGMGFWEFDVPNNRVIWSDELFRIYGLRPQAFEATYEAFLAQVHPDDRETVNQTVQRALQTHDAWSFDHRIVRPDGTVRWLHGRGHVDVVDGAVVRMVGTGTDITHRKRTEERLRIFVANASHELRTPVTAVIQAIGLLRDERSDQPLREELLTVLERQVNRLRDLTQDLLDLASVDSETQTMMIGSVDLDAVVSAAIETTGLAGDVSTEIPTGLVVAGEERALARIFTNLLTNAVRHGSAPVRVEAVAEDVEVSIAVEDSGDGVPAGSADDLFTPFVTGDVSEGSGLGLPMALTLARAMGGTIEYAPAGDVRGRFVVRLGLAP